MNRNPHSTAALTMDDLTPGLRVKIHYHTGQRPWTTEATIVSPVFNRFRPGMGNMPSVELEYPDGRQDTEFLADMGVCPHRGDWLRNYTTRA